jgi:hypothetical protein
MPVSSWVFAALIGLAGAVGQAQEQAQYAQRETSQQSEPSDPNDAPISVIVREPVTVAIDDTSAEARQREEADARQREIDDLVAQQGMNAATQAMNTATQDMRDYAFWQTWLIAIGTGLLFYTLYLTRQTILVTRRIGEAQTAAHISIYDAKIIICDGSSKRRAFCPIVAVRWKNSGMTPAFKLSAKLRIFGVLDGNSIDLGVTNSDLERGAISVEPGQVERTAASPTHISLEKYVTGDEVSLEKMTVVFDVFFFDVFERERRFKEVFETYFIPPQINCIRVGGDGHRMARV